MNKFAIGYGFNGFEGLPDDAVVSFRVASAITGRSKTSLYRHVKAGELTLVKVGCSSRLRVGEIRRLIGV